VAERAAELRGHIESVAGPSRRLVLAGGWARSLAARSVKRAVLGAFEWPRVTEAGARGAALLAGIAAGRYAGVGDLPAPETTGLGRERSRGRAPAKRRDARFMGMGCRER
jgi:sugar (pentulose or hexulose) kinase